MPLWRFMGLVLLGVAGVAALAIWVFPTTEDFRGENPFWNGLAEFRRQYDVTPLPSLEELPREVTDTALVLIPHQKPTGDDIDRIQAYLDGGGTLVLADDYGFGNVVLEGLDTPYRFSQAPLLDPLFNYRDKWFPLATEISPSPWTAEVSLLALNYGTTLEGTELNVLASSSAFSYLDLNHNGLQDSEEPNGPFPVVGYISVAGGRLVLISDPSIFINSMLEAEDNRRFMSNLVTALGPTPRVFLDQSLLPPSTLIEAKGGLARMRVMTGQPWTLSALIGSLIIVLLYPIWRRRGGERR